MGTRLAVTLVAVKVAVMVAAARAAAARAAAKTAGAAMAREGAATVRAGAATAVVVWVAAVRVGAATAGAARVVVEAVLNAYKQRRLRLVAAAAEEKSQRVRVKTHELKALLQEHDPSVDLVLLRRCISEARKEGGQMSQIVTAAERKLEGAESRQAAITAATTRLETAVDNVGMDLHTRGELENAISNAERTEVQQAAMVKARRALESAQQTAEKAERGEACAFYFVKAAKLREASKELARLPNLQALQREHPDWLERKTIPSRRRASTST
jgi:hypothetical protein